MTELYTNLIDYPEESKSIHDIKLTNREFDIISCLIYRRVSDPLISEILAINKRTVESHVRNITLKLQCSTRKIREIIQNQKDCNIFFEHYKRLLNFMQFKQITNKIASLKKSERINTIDVDLYVDDSLIQKFNTFISWLVLCGINVSINSHSSNFSKSPQNNLTNQIMIAKKKSSFK